MSGIISWEKYNGRKIDFKKNLKALFGDYVQASRNKVDNTMATRTDGALALYYTGNLEGTWWLYNLSTDKLIRRNIFKVIPMPDLVIYHINNRKDRELNDDLEIEAELDRNDIRINVDDNAEDRGYKDYINRISDNYIRANGNINGYDHNIVDLTQDNTDIVNADDIININDRIGLHLTINQAINKLGDDAVKSISKEMKQLVDLEAFHGIKLEDLDYNDKKKIIPSSIYLKKKFKADGTFEKLKARLVAGGHRQDETVYEGKTASSTVNTNGSGKSRYRRTISSYGRRTWSILESGNA